MKLWSISTTVRNPYRLKDFLTTLKELDGKEWNQATQIKFQTLLIQNRFYTPTPKDLTEEQIDILDDPTYKMTYEEAYQIFMDKNYEDPAMRGRTSFKPFEKWGLAFIVDHRVYITSTGKKLINNEITMEDVCFRSFLKWQYPDDSSSDFREGYNIKPFIATLHLIKEVNNLCEKRGIKPVGINKDEFGIFALTLTDYRNVKEQAIKLLEYRKGVSEAEDPRVFKEQYILENLSDFTNATVDNIKDYQDNAIRYFRLTKYVYIRGGGWYIDLEPRRQIELDLLLNNDNGSAKEFTREDYIEYMGDYTAYKLPWETETELIRIHNSIKEEVETLQKDLEVEENILDAKKGIEDNIEILREERKKLQNLKLKKDYADIEKIQEAIASFDNIRNLPEKPSVALEKWTNIALNILNDAVEIKPNSPVGDDGEILFTAPGSVPDIEFRYSDFSGIAEVTMLTGRDQWYNEGQPVQRHLRDFEEQNDLVNYCLFISPRLHRDTMNTFWTAVRYEFEGEKQKIIPLNLQQFSSLLTVVIELKKQGKRFKHEYLRNLYDSILDINGIRTSQEWVDGIPAKINSWKTACVSM